MSAEFYVGPPDEPDKYRLVHQVGSGGEAQLWKGELSVSGAWEPVAVKILRADRLGDIDRWAARWGEQAELLRFIRHPGVVGVREHFEGGQMHYAGEPPAGQRALYLVMNWVEGVPLRDWVPLHRGPDAYFESLRYLAQVGDVLDWLHSGQATPSGRPVIHADVTPANVVVTGAGQAVLVDFGLTRLAAGTSPAVEGTGGYMAPEVLAHGAYSPGSDRYSFGALTYFVLTGQSPPADRGAIRAGFSAVPAVNGQPGLVDHLIGMFNPDPAVRPPAGQWIRFFRSSGTTSLGGPGGLQPTVPMTMPPTDDAMAAAIEKPLWRRTPGVVTVAVLAVLLLAGILYAATRGNTTNAASTHAAGGPAPATSTPPIPTTSTTAISSTTNATDSTTTIPTSPPAADPACPKPGPSLVGQDFSGQHVTSKTFACANASRTNFSNAVLDNTNFDHANLSDAIFTGATGAAASFKGAHMRNAKLGRANFNGTLGSSNLGDNFDGADLTSADLTSTQLGAGPLTGPSSLVGATLTSADLSNANLQGVNLSGARLNGANLTNAYLRDANFTHAQLTGANLYGARFDNTICPDGTVTSTGPCPTQ